MPGKYFFLGVFGSPKSLCNISHKKGVEICYFWASYEFKFLHNDLLLGNFLRKVPGDGL